MNTKRKKKEREKERKKEKGKKRKERKKERKKLIKIKSFHKRSSKTSPDDTVRSLYTDVLCEINLNLFRFSSLFPVGYMLFKFRTTRKEELQTNKQAGR